MPDITQFTDYSRTVFTAETKIADAWMREYFERYSVQFDLPEELEEALRFEQAAFDAGFSIAPL